MNMDPEFWRDYGPDRFFDSEEEEDEYIRAMERVPQAPYGRMFDFKLDTLCEIEAYPEEYCTHFLYKSWQEKEFGNAVKIAGVWSEIMKLPDSELLENWQLRELM